MCVCHLCLECPTPALMALCILGNCSARTKLPRSWECCNVQKKHDTISESIFSMLIFLPTFIMHVFVIQYFGMNQHLPSYCMLSIVNDQYLGTNQCLPFNYLCYKLLMINFHNIFSFKCRQEKHGHNVLEHCNRRKCTGTAHSNIWSRNQQVALSFSTCASFLDFSPASPLPSLGWSPEETF